MHTNSFRDNAEKQGNGTSSSRWSRGSTAAVIDLVRRLDGLKREAHRRPAGVMAGTFERAKFAVANGTTQTGQGARSLTALRQARTRH
jgi:hypothetical protein